MSIFLKNEFLQLLHQGPPKGELRILSVSLELTLGGPWTNFQQLPFSSSLVSPSLSLSLSLSRLCYLGPCWVSMCEDVQKEYFHQVGIFLSFLSYLLIGLSSLQVDDYEHNSRCRKGFAHSLLSNELEPRHRWMS